MKVPKNPLALVVSGSLGRPVRRLHRRRAPRVPRRAHHRADSRRAGRHRPRHRLCRLHRQLLQVDVDRRRRLGARPANHEVAVRADVTFIRG